MFNWVTRQRLMFCVHLIFLALVLVPFIFWEEEIRITIQSYLQDAERYEVASIVVASLTLDVFLPVPSSVVATASGLVLGWQLGFVSNFLGLMLGSLLGFVTGHLFRRTLFRRYYDDDEFRQVSYDLANSGFLFLIALRGVPVLAELSVLAAGFHKYSIGRFFLAMVLSNAFLATIGALLGHEAGQNESVYVFAVAFMTVPIIGYGFRIYWLNRNSVQSSL